MNIVEYINAKIRKSDKRTQNVLKNTILSAGMKVASLICSLLIVPITIDYLSPENYGVWMAITSILYWFAFMDVGLGNGMRNYMAEAISREDYHSARSYFSTAVFLLSLIALTIGVICIPLLYLVDLNFIFNTTNIPTIQLANVLTIAISFSLLQFVAKNVGMVYVAMQKYAINDMIVFAGSFSSVIIVYILTKTTASNLAYVVTAFTALPALAFAIAAIPLIIKYPQLIPSINSIDFKSARKIVTKGMGFFLIQITSCLVIFGSANVIISHFCGPEEVTVYNVAYKLFHVLVVGYTIIISPLWNAYTDAYAKQDYTWIRKAFRKSLLFWGGSVVCGLMMLALSGWFFERWIGNSVHIPFAVSACVLAYVCMLNFNNCVTYLINGLNKIRIQIITSVMTTLIYLIAVFIIKDRFGIIGISLSMVGAYIIMSIVHLYQCNLFIKNKAKGIWNK